MLLPILPHAGAMSSHALPQPSLCWPCPFPHSSPIPASTGPATFPLNLHHPCMYRSRPFSSSSLILALAGPAPLARHSDCAIVCMGVVKGRHLKFVGIALCDIKCVCKGRIKFKKTSFAS